jgi:hypothetical protein
LGSCAGRDNAPVRKHYHFRPEEHGLDAWDVDRLLELSKALPVREVNLASIEEIDSLHWFEDALERPTKRTVGAAGLEPATSAL